MRGRVLTMMGGNRRGFSINQKIIILKCASEQSQLASGECGGRLENTRRRAC